ncbi:hypothetical protein E2C01_083034 [Portunus trituberculatus]|uniref:Uncharacterized protein n=1 Tax=Portunus trituberculatus TaxID=210409 RepID=A0A5B7ITV1_PORTR|nr:hypothetical protein [Portunus trituberculatus]
MRQAAGRGLLGTHVAVPVPLHSALTTWLLSPLHSSTTLFEKQVYQEANTGSYKNTFENLTTSTRYFNALVITGTKNTPLKTQQLPNSQPPVQSSH